VQVNGIRRIIVFARFPEPGRVKTRLIPALGPLGAARLHRRLVRRTLHTAEAAARACNSQLELHFDGADQDRIQCWLGDSLQCRHQQPGNLGERMARAFDDGFRDDCGAIVLIGSDCPGVSKQILAAAFKALEQKPVVLGPAADGGYYLVGLVRPVPELFRSIAWGGDQVLSASIENLKRIGISPSLLPELPDIDRPADLEIWNRLVESETGPCHKVSVIVPALNESATILATLESIQRENPHEVVVVDGGSTDDTCQLAAGSGTRVVCSKAGRARQMNAGAAKASGDVLLFVHSDTILPTGWQRLILEGLFRRRAIAGAFGFQIGEHVVGKRIVEWGTNWRSHWCQMPYGDQGLFLKRDTFEEEGGFADLPIMEDYEFIRRLRRRGKIVTLTAKAITSSRRWKKVGLLRTMLLNQLTIIGYHLGVHPSRLAHHYRKKGAAAPVI
jgi:uncharacterized protein